MILHALRPGALLDARLGGRLPEPWLLRRLPAPGPGGAATPARAPRAAAGAFLRTRLGTAARRRQERARRLPRRRPGGSRLRPQRDHRRERRAALAGARAWRPARGDRPRLQRVPERARLRGRGRPGGVRPVVISHGANSPRTDRSRLLLEFDWTGSHDPTPYLCVPEAVRFLSGLLPGGWPALMARNRALALEARRILCDALDAEPPAPEDMVGALAAVPLPDGSAAPLRSPLYADPLQDVLLERYGIEVPIMPWPAPPKRLVRVSCQAYNAREDYERLAAALRELTRGAA